MTICTYFYVPVSIEIHRRYHRTVWGQTPRADAGKGVSPQRYACRFTLCSTSVDALLFPVLG